MRAGWPAGQSHLSGSAVQIPFIEEPRRMPDVRWEKYVERLGTSESDTMRIPITPQGWNMTLRTTAAA